MLKPFHFQSRTIQLAVVPEWVGGMLVGSVTFEVMAKQVLRWSHDDTLCLWPFQGMLCEMRALSLRPFPDGNVHGSIDNGDVNARTFPMTSTESLDGADFSVGGTRDEVTISWVKWEDWGDDDDGFPDAGTVQLDRADLELTIRAFTVYMHDLHSSIST